MICLPQTTSLLDASEKGEVARVRELLAAGVSANVTSNWRETPLFMAAAKGHTEVVEILLASSADPAIETKERTHGALYVHGPSTALIEAIKGKHGKVIDLLLGSGVDVTTSTADGCTALHVAAYNDQLDTARALLAGGAHVNARLKRSGATPLHWAAENASAELVRLLLDAGADITAKDEKGRLAVHLAGEKRHPGVKALFLSLQPQAGRSPVVLAEELIAAVGKGDQNLVSECLAAGAEVNRRVRDRTSLDRAAELGHLEIARLLVENGADVNAGDSQGWTPLHSAAQGLNSAQYSVASKIAVAELLIARGANVRARSADATGLDGIRRAGVTPIEVARAWGHRDIETLLLCGSARPAGELG